MEKELKMKITIETSSEEEQFAIGNSIHNQLRGNLDYMENNIVLNIDVKNKIRLYIFKECEKIPNIVI